MICTEKSSKNFYFCCESKLFAMLHTEKEPLYGKTLTRLQSICTELGLPRFAAKQIARWLYVQHVADIDEMTNISKALIEKLRESATLITLRKETFQESKLDGTRNSNVVASSEGRNEDAMRPTGLTGLP